MLSEMGQIDDQAQECIDALKALARGEHVRVAANDDTDIGRIGQAINALADRAEQVPTLPAVSSGGSEDDLTAPGVGTWHWNLTEGLVQWDDNLHRIFGEQPGAFDGRFDDYVDRIHPDDRERVIKENLDAAERLDDYEGSYRIVLPSGDVRRLAFRSRFFRDRAGTATGCIGVAWDATKAKTVEAESRRVAKQAHELHDFTRSIVQTVRHPLLALDQDLRILVANRAFCTKFGLREDVAVGRLIYELDDGRWNVPKLRTLLNDVLPKRKSVRDYRIQQDSTMDGRRTLLLNAEEMHRPGHDVSTILVSIDDVTELETKADADKKGRQGLSKRLRETRQSLAVSQAALSETESLLVQFLECIPFGVFVCDGDGQPYYANEHAKSILGQGIVPGTTPDDFAEIYQAYVEGTDTPYPSERMPIALALAGEEATSTDTEIQRPEGRIPLWVSAAPVRDTNGEVQFAIAVFRDVTEQRKLEGQLRQAQRMEAVGQLAGGVAHDFNNLLTAILGFADFALQELRPEERAYKDLQQVLAAARRAEALTRQLLAFSRKQIIAPKVLNFTEQVSEMDRMLRRILGEDIEFATLLADDLWNTKVDPGALEQVVVNLAVNSRDAMPTGGKLTIETVNVRLDGDYGSKRGVEVPPGEYVCLNVSDTGSGMDADTRRKIFEPFFTTKDEGKGTGLGLATCYGIVKQAGGYIWVYSEVGKGTTFKVYLPRVQEPQQSAADRPLSLAPPTGNETILVAEDDEQLRCSAVRALKNQGYEVLEAANGGEALLLAENAGAIDLLLTDVVMPRISGKLLADRLASQHPQMRVLFMSGYTDNSIVHHGVLDEGIAFLHKPFSPAELARRVRTVLDTEQPQIARRPSVLLVDDNVELLRSLQRKLANSYDVTLANGGLAGRELLRQKSFDLVLCDIMMPDLSGIELHEEMTKVRPSVAEHFVFMTGADSEAVEGFLRKTNIDVIRKEELTADVSTVVAESIRPAAPVVD